MYPTLYHAFFDLFGIEILFLKAIPMFGFWVAMGFISGSYLYTIELQRKESENVIFSTSKKMLIGLPPSPIELLLNGLMGFVLGGKLLYLIQDTSVFNDFPHFILSSKVSLLGGLIGALVFGYWKYWETSKNKLSEPIEQEIEVKPHHHVSNLTMIAVIGGILGAKLFAYVESPGRIIEFLTNYIQMNKFCTHHPIEYK